MNLIQKVGGIGLAEAIASCLLTTAVDPQYYCLDPKQYFNVVNGVVYFYDDETQQFLEWGMFFGCSFKYVSISTLRAAIAAYDYNRTDNLSHFTDNCTDIRNHDLSVSNSSQNDTQIDLSIKMDIEDNCTDIRNHLSPNTKVIEHE